MTSGSQAGSSHFFTAGADTNQQKGRMDDADRSTSVIVDGADTVLTVKKSIQDESGIPVQEQTLYFEGRALNDWETLSDAGIGENASVDVYGISKNVDRMIRGFFKDETPSSASAGLGSPKCSASCSSSCDAVCSSGGAALSSRCNAKPAPANPANRSEFVSEIMSRLGTRRVDGVGGACGGCAVCQYDCKAGDVIVETPCGHVFHVKCLQPWLKVNTTCPQCRHELSSDKHPQSFATAKPKRQACGAKRSRSPSRGTATPPPTKRGGVAVAPVGCVHVDSCDRVGSINGLVSKFPSGLVRMSCNGRVLREDQTLGQQEIREGSDMSFLLRLDRVGVVDTKEKPAHKPFQAPLHACVPAGATLPTACPVAFARVATATAATDKTSSAASVATPLVAASVVGPVVPCGLYAAPLQHAVTPLLSPPPTQSRCTVCQFNFRPGEKPVVQTICGHVFHRACLEPWLALRTTCPQCRSGLFVPPNFLWQQQQQLRQLQLLQQLQRAASSARQ